MRKLGGILVIGLLALTACSAPEQLQAQPVVGNVPSTTASIAPAPIQQRDLATSAPATLDPGQNYGDMTQDEFYLNGVTPGWRGEVPSDEELIGAALLACEQFKAGGTHADIRVVQGDSEDADWNNQKVVMLGGQVYCYDVGFIGPP